MKASSRHIVLCQTAIAIAVLAAFGSARADSQGEGSVSVGAGAVSGNSADRSLFGQYNGMRNDSGYGLLDFSYYRVNPDTGTTVDARGTNLGLDTRELQLDWQRQGNWKFSLNYGELTRRDPYTVNTGLLGAGSSTPQVSYLSGGVGSGSDLTLSTKRTSLGVAFSKWFNPAVQLEVSLKGEKKEGSRLFGIGITCGSPVTPGCAAPDAFTAGTGILLLPEPIDSNHAQVEARVNYAGAKLRLSAGYYGSFFNNQFATLNPNVSGSLNSPLGAPLTPSAGLLSILNNPVALAPDNQAHQFDLTGNYAFTPTTRANFKLAYGQATQKQDFGASFAGVPMGVTNLGARVDTTLAQVGITSRPLPKLSLLAEARYEDKDDKTPLALYNVEGFGTYAYTNMRLPNTKTRGRLMATYQITNEIQGSVGANYEHIDRGTFTPTSAVAGITALRQKTDETGFYVDLRRRMTETLSGSIRLETSDRTGSNWLQPSSTGFGVTEVTAPSITFNDSIAILMPTLADRRRNKGKLTATWQPMDELSLQLVAEGGEDKYRGSDQGLRSTHMELYSLDADYLLSDEYSVRLTGYASIGSQRLNQARPGGYILGFDNSNTSVGLGIVGKPTEKIDLGGGVTFINDKNVYAQTLDASALPGNAALLAAAGGLPDIVYRSTQVKLYGKYALSEASTVRLDAMYQRAKYNDWAYGYNGVPYTYSDNTTVWIKPVQEVTFFGVTYIYAWK